MATITGTVTDAHADARTAIPTLPGAFPVQGFTIRTDDGAEHTTVVMVGSAADAASGRTPELLATVGQRVTATGGEKSYGFLVRNAAGFTVEA